MHNKVKGAILTIVLLAFAGGGLYFFLNKKYYPKIEDVSYLKLAITNDSAQVKAGVRVQNRIPLPITFDSIHYTIKNEETTLGRGRMLTTQTLPPLGDEVLDLGMMLNLDKYRQHMQQKDKDSMQLTITADVFFDLPLISQKSISLNRHLKVPVSKAPSLKLDEIVVRNFSVDSGYSFLLKLDASNRNLPDLHIRDFGYRIRIGDSLLITGQVDTAFQLQKGGELLEIPLQLKTSDAVALIRKVLSGEDQWHYTAQVTAQIRSSRKLFDKFELVVEKEGMLNMSTMSSRTNYLPSVRQVKQLKIDSKEEQTLLQAEVVVHNPAPIPIYIDSASYFIRHQGKIIASGTKDFEKVLKKSGDQTLNLALLVDESAYKQFMKNRQGQQEATLAIELNLLYNLPGAERQSIRLQRQVQVPLQGHTSIKVAGLSVRELSPQKGASLTLRLQVQRTNMPDLSIRNLDYTLQLGEGLVITGHTQEPIEVSSEDATVEVPIHLSAEDVNQLIDKALKGSKNWNYELKASAELISSHDIIGPTKLNFSFSGELETSKSMSGKQFVPHISRIDTLSVFIHYDTAWIKLNINVENPLPVDLKVDSLLLTLSHANDTFAISRESVGKVLPAHGAQSAWITLAVNYELWQQYLHQYRSQDSLRLKETVTLAYQLGNLPQQRTTFYNMLRMATPDTPSVSLSKVKLRGFSFSKGILVSGQVQVKNRNAKKLVVSGLTYSACVENLLDVCGTVDSTYHVFQGSNVVSIPMSLGVGEVARALFARLTGNTKRRSIFLNATATVDTSNPKLQNTFVRLELWRRAVLFQKKEKNQISQNRQTACR
ncbi:hypothetical protein I2I11_05390 [Pontibacter sp. 172403-2]|uniref:hypothetical protein n=1 Tax=Pontibacter rufus TaxID=2791028 RepID=UPI0018AFC53E|nr:hypothetical protein [Pontibacter sp. 172403-2]MBF9252713.1 hypothetical protein [Pontibacter sp. 172403-2]